MNNYEKTLLRAEQVFLTFRQEDMIEACKLTADTDFIYIDFFQQPFRIHRNSGRIEAIEKNSFRHGTFSEGMAIFDYICEPIPYRSLCGETVDVHYFAKVGFSGKDLYQKYVNAFGDDIPRFRTACENLGGTPFAKGDAGYTFEVFPNFPLTLILWAGEEGIPAAMQYLWDKNAADFIRFETMFYIISHLMEKIAAAMHCAIEPFAAAKAETKLSPD